MLRLGDLTAQDVTALTEPAFTPRLAGMVRARGGECQAQALTWLAYHQAPRAASAAIGAAVVANALGPENATPEVVAYLLGCRTRQILPAIEDYFVQKKGTKKGDMD
jgi:hypothetical protein